MPIEVVSTVEPVKLGLEPAAGTLAGRSARYEKRLRDLKGIYRDAARFSAMAAQRGDEVVYWVESSAVQPGAGGLVTGLSTLTPGRVGEEYFMTRGHLHVRTECGETYLGVAGSGVLLLDALDGRCRAIAISPGEAVYVPGGWVHRSVNVGAGLLVTLFCYPADAGQDYGVIQHAGGMSNLVVASEDSGWTTRPNPEHRGYGT